MAGEWQIWREHDAHTRGSSFFGLRPSHGIGQSDAIDMLQRSEGHQSPPDEGMHKDALS